MFGRLVYHSFGQANLMDGSLSACEAALTGGLSYPPTILLLQEKGSSADCTIPETFCTVQQIGVWRAWLCILC